MAIKVHNTLTNKKEEFKPQNKDMVSMYVCGVTPYDEVHLGHARAYVVFDIIKRHLLKSGFKVKHIQNFTDVDDKIIKRATEKNIKPSELAQTYIDDYFSQTGKLNILKAEEYPRVTEMIPEIIDFVKTLIEKGFAYEVDGDVYFSVDKFKEYGKLSKRCLEDLKAGARVDICNEKASAFDFALWKRSKENEPADVSWDSPWGKGRPGWHIECSVMSSKRLGDTIDIHGGGQDLIFPHHENEIAQSEAKTGKQFVKYWIHNGFVTINKEKMSKSLNNFFTLRSIFEKYDPRVVRYYLMTQHYSSPLDFSDEGLSAAKNTLQGLDDAYTRLVTREINETLTFDDGSAVIPLDNIQAVDMISPENSSAIEDEDLIAVKNDFMEALDDDFNSEKALSFIHKLKNMILNELQTASRSRMLQMKSLYEELTEDSLGIPLPSPFPQDGDSFLNDLLSARNRARKEKNWAEADRLRKEIDEKGYKITDNPDGTSVLTKKI